MVVLGESCTCVRFMRAAVIEERRERVEGDLGRGHDWKHKSPMGTIKLLIPTLRIHFHAKIQLELPPKSKDPQVDAS
jgi:hypothetical protein